MPINNRPVLPEGCQREQRDQPQAVPLSYASVDDVRIVQRLGCGSVLAKFDLVVAYQVVPAYLQDCLQLSMAWQGECS